MDSMDRDESVDALKASIDESMAEAARLNNELIGLETYRGKILAEGMSKSIGIGLEHIAPGTLGKLNLNMLTETPSVTKMNVALEAIDWKSRITKVAIVILVVTVILKMIDWLLTPSTNRVSGSSSDGDAAARSIHEAKEKIREEIKKAGKDIHDRPVQNVVLEVSKRDEEWMKPVYQILAEQVDKKRYNDKEALRCIEIMRLYRAADLGDIGDREENLALLFSFLLKSGLALNLTHFGFYIGNEPGREIEETIPAPFAKDAFSYNVLRTNLGYALLTISRILKQGTDAGVEAERGYKASGDKSKFDSFVNEIAQEVTMYNDELKRSFDYVFGDAQSRPAFIFNVLETPTRWVPSQLIINRYGKLSSNMRSYIGQPRGSTYNHDTFMTAVAGRNSEDYKAVGSNGENMWWGEGYEGMSKIGILDIRARDGSKELNIPIDPLDIKVANWLLRTLCNEDELKRAIHESNTRMMVLKDEFMGSGNTETMRLKELCEQLLRELKVIEQRSRENVPTVWHVPWKNTTGLHFSDVEAGSGKDRGIINSTFGEVCMHLLNGTKGLLTAFITTKTVYQKVENSYLAFREATKKFRL